MANDNNGNEVLTVLAPFEYSGALRESASQFMVNVFEKMSSDSISDILIETAMYMICGVNWCQPQCAVVSAAEPAEAIEEHKQPETGEQNGDLE